ncbi:LGFP repeat-containing protein [Kineococcus gynurae]|uniref:LGFP repeat-containing protein n=1 Tax=Kineococcus gynurae TaxID=452979 RepID=A0ABV5LRY7_9ACTN
MNTTGAVRKPTRRTARPGLVAGLVTGLVTGLGLLAPIDDARADVPDPAGYPDLTITASCVQGRTGAVTRFVTDGRPIRVSFSPATTSTPLRTDRGTPVAVSTDLPVGEQWGTLLDPSNRDLATRPLTVATCDGWPSLSAYRASTASAPGSPQELATAGGRFVVDRTGVGHVVRGAIHDRWRAAGSERSFLGLPRTSEFQLSTLDGFYTEFDGGVVYWGPQAGAHVLRGALLAGYADRDFERSGMGLPVTDEFGPLWRNGFGQHFEHASLYWSPATGAHRVHGAIRNTWAAQGWERGALGYPVGDEFLVDGGRQARQDYQGGSLVYSFATDRVSRR